MPAELENMFYARDGGTPWHQSGTPVDKLATAEEAVAAAGLLRVVKRPMYVGDTQVDGWVCMVREDGVQLGVCSSERGLIQPLELYHGVQPLVDAGKATYETGGSLRGGKTIWAQLKLVIDPFEVVPGDVIEPYLLATASYDRANHWRFVKTRVVCNNTMQMALRETKKEVDLDASDASTESDPVYAVRFINSPNVKDRIAQSQEILNIAVADNKRTMEVCRGMAKVGLRKRTMEAFFERIIPDDDTPGADNSRRERARAELLTACEIGMGTEIKGVRGTLWGALNAVTEWVDHGRGSVGGRDPGMRSLPDPSQRLTNIFSGAGARIKNRATKVAIELVGISA